MQVTAIIAAGGRGQRLGAPVPKQLLDVGGRTVLQRSVDAFRTHPAVGEVIVAVPPDLLDALLDSPPGWLDGVRGVRLVAGGARRQDSVANAFDAVAMDAEIVLVHDAARPFVTSDVISRAIEGAVAHGAAIVAVPVSDTVKRVGVADGVIVETLPREEIFLAQTPQAFRRDVLGAAIAAGRDADSVTDEAMLAERAGHRVHVVPGDPANVKITTAADLDGARAPRANVSRRRGPRGRGLRFAPPGRGTAARARGSDRAVGARCGRTLRCRRHLSRRDRRDPWRRHGPATSASTIRIRIRGGRARQAWCS